MRSIGNSPDWTHAPPWAHWWATDADGEAFWYECRPRLGARMWFRVGGRAHLADALNPQCVNWRKAVQRDEARVYPVVGHRAK